MLSVNAVAHAKGVLGDCVVGDGAKSCAGFELGDSGAACSWLRVSFNWSRKVATVYNNNKRTVRCKRWEVEPCRDTHPPRTMLTVASCGDLRSILVASIAIARLDLSRYYAIFDPSATSPPLLLICLACGGGVPLGYMVCQELGYMRSDAWRHAHVPT